MYINVVTSRRLRAVRLRRFLRSDYEPRAVVNSRGRSLEQSALGLVLVNQRGGNTLFRNAH